MKTTETRKVQETVPVVSWKSQRIGGLIVTKVPTTKTETRFVDKKVPVEKLVDATPEEIATWNKAVEETQAHYEAAINAEIARRVAEKVKQRRSDVIEGVLKITKEGVVPMLTAVSGLIGAIAVLGKSKNDQSDKDKPRRRRRTRKVGSS